MSKILMILASAFIFNVCFASSPAPEAHGQAKAKHDPGSLFPQPKQNKDKSTPPVKASLVEPAFMAKINATAVTLKWNTVAGAENYHLQVATDPNFKWLKVDNQFQKTATFELTGLEAGKSYYWRVAAVKNSNDSMYIKGEYEKSMFETTAK